MGFLPSPIGQYSSRFSSFLVFLFEHSSEDDCDGEQGGVPGFYVPLRFHCDADEGFSGVIIPVIVLAAMSLWLVVGRLCREGVV